MTHDDDSLQAAARTPAWVTATQAAILGIVAGLALNALVSIVVQGKEQAPVRPAHSECQKRNPARDASTPSRSGSPRISAVETHGAIIRAS
jgi:uncharacterized protein YggE